MPPTASMTWKGMSSVASCREGSWPSPELGQQVHASTYQVRCAGVVVFGQRLRAHASG